MDYSTLLTRIIEDGIAEVREAYADPKEHHKRDGAIEGFEACRGKTPAELGELLRATDAEFLESGRELRSMKDTYAYWRIRYKALQVEWVANVISVATTQNGRPPIAPHMPTARAAMKYAAVVGVQGAENPS